MKEHLQRLSQLVKTDYEIQNLKERLHEVPEKLRNLENELQEIETSWGLQQARRETCSRELREIQTKTEEEQVRLQAKEERARALKTNKEYQASLKEIAAGKTLLQELAAKAQSLTQELEKIGQEISTLEGRKDELQSSLATEHQSISTELESLQRSLTEAEHASIHQMSGLPEDVRHQYMRVQSRRQPAAALILSGICQECFMNIPPQLAIEIRKYQEVHACPNCHRLLYTE